MLFLTDVTPETVRVTAAAGATSERSLTKPLSWTKPLNVSTLISLALSSEKQIGKLDTHGG